MTIKVSLYFWQSDTILLQVFSTEHRRLFSYAVSFTIIHQYDLDSLSSFSASIGFKAVYFIYPRLRAPSPFLYHASRLSLSSPPHPLTHFHLHKQVAPLTADPHSFKNNKEKKMSKRTAKVQENTDLGVSKTPAEGANANQIVFGVAHIFASFNDTFVVSQRHKKKRCEYCE